MRIAAGRTIFAQTPYLTNHVFFANNKAGQEPADNTGSTVPWL
jgi:hypothetical protein